MNALACARLGRHLRRLREERKLTLGGVERLTAQHAEKINKSYLFRVETGKTLPTLSRLHVLARVYRVRLSRLLDVVQGAIDESERTEGTPIPARDGTFEELRESGLEAEKEGDFTRATIIYRAALDKASDEPASRERSRRIATVRNDLAIALKKSRKLDLAQIEAEGALEAEGLPTELRDKIIVNLADVYRRTGRKELSSILVSELLSRSDEIQKNVLLATHSLKGSLLLDDDSREATKHYRSALAIIKPLSRPLDECMLLFNIGLAESKASNFRRALKSMLSAHALAKRKDYIYLVAKTQTEIGRIHYLRGDRAEARTALREANRLARDREYYEQLFINGYYLRRLAIEDGDDAQARSIEAGLRFFATRIQESFEELEAFRAETAADQEASR